MLNQPVGAGTRDADVGRKRVNDPLFVLVAPQSVVVHLSQDIEMAGAEHGCPHAAAVQSDRAVVEADEIHGELQKALDEQVADNLFFGLTIR